MLLHLLSEKLFFFKSQELRREPEIVPKSAAEVSWDPCGARESGFERFRESGIEKSVSEASQISGTQRNPADIGSCQSSKLSKWHRM